MRTIERSTAFRRDYKRVKATPKYSKKLDALLSEVLAQLLVDQVLPTSYCDHALNGNWNGYRECHLRPDLLLIYQKFEPDILRLARMGTHSELFN